MTQLQQTLAHVESLALLAERELQALVDEQTGIERRHAELRVEVPKAGQRARDLRRAAQVLAGDVLNGNTVS